jgi:hypothetical protein
LEQRATHISEPYGPHPERAAPLPLRTPLISLCHAYRSSLRRLGAKPDDHLQRFCTTS